MKIFNKWPIRRPTEPGGQCTKSCRKCVTTELKGTYGFAVRKTTLVTTLTNDDRAKISLKGRSYHAPYWSFTLLLGLCVRFHIMTNRLIQIWNLQPQNIVFLGAYRPKYVKVFFYVSLCIRSWQKIHIPSCWDYLQTSSASRASSPCHWTGCLVLQMSPKN